MIYDVYMRITDSLIKLAKTVDIKMNLNLSFYLFMLIIEVTLILLPTLDGFL